MKKRFSFLLLIVICLFLKKAVAQQFHLEIFPEDSGKVENHTFDKLPEVWQFIRQKQNKLLEKGYLACSVDSISIHDSIVKVRFYTGSHYQWAKIDFTGVPVGLWNQLNISKADWQGVSVDPKKLAALHEKVLDYCDNNGYPFAYTYLDSFKDEKDGLVAKFHLVTGQLQRIDTIIVSGDVEISLSFLENYLSIYQGGLYNESQLLKIRKRLQELPFLTEDKPWKMEFTIDKNKLYLYLKPKKSNQINGLIGLQPNTQETGKFLLTADFLLALQNSLGFGETIETTYKNLEYKSPQFHAHVVAPYVLGTPFGLEGSFDLYKKDTTYRKLTFEAGIRYQLQAEDYVRLFYQTISNRLITADTHYVHLNKKLPDNIDVRTQGLGIETAIDRTDFKLNPRKGWLVNFTVTGNIRNVLPNDAILSIEDASGFDYQSLYKQANENKYQLHANASAAWFFPIYKAIVGKINYQGGYIYGKDLFQNELFQIGGFSTLRGFDENAFFADQYQIGSVEVHFNFGTESYFYLFSDNAFVQTRFQNVDQKDFPVSFGTGLSLENKTGIFNIAIGIGKHSGEAFQFRNAKIHFGYAAYF